MVIDKFVHIEGSVDVENIHVIDLPIDRCIRRELREQMRTTNNGVKMDDTHVACSPMGGFRVYIRKQGINLFTYPAYFDLFPAI
jgi:hypothetical protein